MEAPPFLGLKIDFLWSTFEYHVLITDAKVGRIPDIYNKKIAFSSAFPPHFFGISSAFLRFKPKKCRRNTI